MQNLARANKADSGASEDTKRPGEDRRKYRHLRQAQCMITMEFAMSVVLLASYDILLACQQPGPDTTESSYGYARSDTSTCIQQRAFAIQLAGLF